MSMIKLFIVLLFVTILASLGSALYYIARHKGEASVQVANALSWRVGLSLLAFFLLLLAFALGWIAPH